MQKLGLLTPAFPIGEGALEPKEPDNGKKTQLGNEGEKDGVVHGDHGSQK